MLLKAQAEDKADMDIVEFPAIMPWQTHGRNTSQDLESNYRGSKMESRICKTQLMRSVNQKRGYIMGTRTISVGSYYSKL